MIFVEKNADAVVNELEAGSSLPGLDQVSGVYRIYLNLNRVNLKYKSNSCLYVIVYWLSKQLQWVKFLQLN